MMLQEEVSRFPGVQACDVIQSGALRVATACTYPNGEHVDVFILEDGKQGYWLSDDGEALYRLESCAGSHQGSARLRSLVMRVCDALGACLYVGGHLQTHVRREEDLPGAIERLAQACVRMNGLLCEAAP